MHRKQQGAPTSLMTDRSSDMPRAAGLLTAVQLLAAILALFFCCFGTGCSGSAAREAIQTAPPAHMRQFRDFEELAEALGFDMIQIAGAGFAAERFALIDGEIGEIIYRSGDIEVNLRMSKGTNDISGVGVTNYTSQDVRGTEIRTGSYGDIQVAWFMADGYDYALSAVGMTQNEFSSFVDQLVAGALPS